VSAPTRGAEVLSADLTWVTDSEEVGLGWVHGTAVVRVQIHSPVGKDKAGRFEAGPVPDHLTRMEFEAKLAERIEACVPVAGPLLVVLRRIRWAPKELLRDGPVCWVDFAIGGSHLDLVLVRRRTDGRREVCLSADYRQGRVDAEGRRLLTNPATRASIEALILAEVSLEEFSR
jgi:hypothetical protein